MNAIKLKNGKYIKLVSRSKAKTELDKYLKDLEGDPKYQEILQKYKSGIDHSLTPLVDTNVSTMANDDLVIFQQAEQLLEQLENGDITLGMLDLYSKSKILYYLERYNKRVGRILDILTRIPTSSITLQKPKSQYAIVNDYVYKKFNELFQSEGFLAMLEKVVRHYWLFSFASVLIEDDYTFKKGSNLLDDIDVVRSLRSIMKDVDKSKTSNLSHEELIKIDKRYIDAPSEVSAEERRRFLGQVLSVHSPKYRGVFRLSVLPVSATIERSENNDVDYFIYNIPITENLKDSVESIRSQLDPNDVNSYSVLLEQVNAVGYSEAMLNAVLNSQDPSTELGRAIKATNNSSAPIDTNPYNDIGAYVVTIKRQGLAQKDNSIFNRVLMDAVDLAVSQRRLREKINRGFKKDILVTLGDKEDEESIAALQTVLDQAAQNDEGSFIVTNMDVNTSELDLNVNSNLDLQDIIEQGNQNISEGVGISESLITDSTDAYSNAFLKTCLLENELTSFRTALTSFIEKKIFEPIAIKLGFIIKDEWGDPQVLYPKLSFSRMTLARGSDDLDTISELVSENKLPQSVLLEAMGFDTDAVLTQLRDESLTLMNPALRDKFSELVGEKAAEALSKNERLLKRLAENLDVDPQALAKALQESDDTGGGGFGRR